MPQAIEQLEESRPVFASLRQTQAFVVRQLAEQLELAPALADAAAGPGVPLEVASPDGGAAVALQAFSGPGLRWLSASALASPSLGFGGAITAGFAEGCSDVPHFRLDHKLLGDQVRRGTLWRLACHTPSGAAALGLPAKPLCAAPACPGLPLRRFDAPRLVPAPLPLTCSAGAAGAGAVPPQGLVPGRILPAALLWLKYAGAGRGQQVAPHHSLHLDRYTNTSHHSTHAPPPPPLPVAPTLHPCAAPPGSQRSYNDVYNSALQRPGWKLYQTAALAVKPLLSSAMAFTYEPSEVGVVWWRSRGRRQPVQAWTSETKRCPPPVHLSPATLPGKF